MLSAKIRSSYWFRIWIVENISSRLGQLVAVKSVFFAGFGLSLCYVAAIIIVAYYFDRKRSFATGVSVCGSGVGT